MTPDEPETIWFSVLEEVDSTTVTVRLPGRFVSILPYRAQMFLINWRRLGWRKAFYFLVRL